MSISSGTPCSPTIQHRRGKVRESSLLRPRHFASIEGEAEAEGIDRARLPPALQLVDAARLKDFEEPLKVTMLSRLDPCTSDVELFFSLNLDEKGKGTL